MESLTVRDPNDPAWMESVASESRPAYEAMRSQSTIVAKTKAK